MPDTADAPAPCVLFRLFSFRFQRGGESKRKDKCVAELSEFGACVDFRKRQIDAERYDFNHGIEPLDDLRLGPHSPGAAHPDPRVRLVLREREICQ
jgi:hypothetical protein